MAHPLLPLDSQNYCSRVLLGGGCAQHMPGDPAHTLMLVIIGLKDGDWDIGACSR
jgi:hypothetical protein